MPSKVSSLLLGLILFASPVFGQFYTLETDQLRLVYYGRTHDYLVEHVARSFENSLDFHQGLFDYTPSEKVTVLLHDLSDYGNAGADVLPRNTIVVGIAPFSYVFETAPANERMNATMNHELMHIVANDKSAQRDNAFRTLFLGKVDVVAADPVSILYSYLTAPRRYAPRWYQEGIAVFMETWMAGGLGRSLGGYDEMVFRTKVRDDSHLYDMVGLESEGTTIDFQVGVNSYLYGTRFMSYLAYIYGPERVIEWTSRTPESKGHFTSAFKEVFGKSLTEGWADWIAWERQFQQENLKKIRSNSTTPYRPLSKRTLGSVSRGHYDPVENKLYAAVNFPGQVAHIAAIDMEDGSMKRVVDIKGASLYSVSSLAYDASSQALFYTTDNNDWRNLHAVDVKTGRSRMLQKEVRVGDLAFNPVDRSLWGVRHFLGISTLVRIPEPYDEWDQIYSWDYGKDLYDIDVSPDGKYVTGALAEISGQQTLIRMEVEKLLAGDTSYETLFDFDVSNPESFAFSPEGRYLVGSSYYSGVSNIFRYDLGAKRMEVLSNAETGFFRPVPISDDSLIVFRYSGEGFSPVMIANQPANKVSAIDFLGQKVVESHPVVRDWLAGSPAAVALDSLTIADEEYHGLQKMRLTSGYPVIQGYKDYAAIGLRLNFSEPIGFHKLSMSASYSPTTSLPADERWHGYLTYRYRNWTLEATHNQADFYDLFGPRKTSRKGSSLGLQFKRNLLYDAPRSLEVTARATGYVGLERLPDHQNIPTSFSELVSMGASLQYKNLRSSLGAVDYEKGTRWSLAAGANLANKIVYPRIWGDVHFGFPLFKHSSLWLRTYGGFSTRDRDEPFANFFFGAFGNNWVDYQEVKRYQDYVSFPGLDFDAIGGTSFGKAMVEWILPPLRFEHVGGTSLFLKWARLSLFSAALLTNVGSDTYRQAAASVGGQVDFRIMLFSYLRTTFSLGYGVATIDGNALQDEVMISFKIL